MAFISDEVFDQGLDWADITGTRLDITSTDPVGVYGTVTGNSLGIKVIGATPPEDADSGTGRQVTVPAITDGAVTGTDSATYWAIHNATDTVVASGALSAPQDVTSGNTFTLDEILITLRDPV
jgi:hypothetical protein